MLAIEEEATIVVFRRHTLLPLDDCLIYALQPSIPHLTRSYNLTDNPVLNNCRRQAAENGIKHRLTKPNNLGPMVRSNG